MARSVLVYTVKVPRWLSQDALSDMLQYCGDRVAERQNDTITLRRYIRFSKNRDFFYSHIKPRWESFGCEVINIHEEKPTTEDHLFTKRGIEK